MTNDPFLLAGAALIVLAGLAALGAIAFVAIRAMRRADAEAAQQQMSELARLQVETSARMVEMRDMLAGRQAELARVVNDQQTELARVVSDRQVELAKVVNDRLDAVTHRLGQSMETSRQHTVENLQKLNERLAVIDGAQKNITALASQVTSLQNVLASKQNRGAFGQARMEAIVQDGLPKGCYEFQHTLSNRTRPDCAVFFPDQRPLIVDAKFPLEAVTAFRDAKTDDERKAASARVRADIGKHVGDIAGKYLIPGETYDIAFMFVPSESVYAELHESFDDVVQKAYRASVLIVSPTLLMLAINVVQQIQKDVRMREAADKIHAEVGHLMEDIRRLHERVLKLQHHFGQANDDIQQIVISADKVAKRGARIREVEFDEDDEAPPSNVIPAPMQRKLQLGE